MWGIDTMTTRDRTPWELFCVHANENPNICPCPSHCGCRTQSEMCKGKLLNPDELNNIALTARRHEEMALKARDQYDEDRRVAYQEMCGWRERAKLAEAELKALKTRVEDLEGQIANALL